MDRTDPVPAGHFDNPALAALSSRTNNTATREGDFMYPLQGMRMIGLEHAAAAPLCTRPLADRTPT
jgi:hypothetical protein